MTIEDQIFLDRINLFAEKVLSDIDPQKTQISLQLEKLRPVMEEIARDENKSIEEIFIRYMDLASEYSLTKEKKLQSDLKSVANSDSLF